MSTSPSSQPAPREPSGLPRREDPKARPGRRLWSKSSVALLLDVERSFVDALIRRGELTVVPLGYRTHRVTDRSLKGYLKRIGA